MILRLRVQCILAPLSLHKIESAFGFCVSLFGTASVPEFGRLEITTVFVQKPKVHLRSSVSLSCSSFKPISCSVIFSILDMEESDDDESSDEEAELDMETFDTQRLVKDEEDQKYLDSLPEFEREAILGERFEKRKAEHDMKKALRESK